MGRMKKLKKNWRRMRQTEEDWFVFSFLEFGGLWPLPAAGAPPKEREQKKRQIKLTRPSIQSHQINFQFIWLVIELEWLIGLFFFFCGLRAAAGRTAPQKRREQQHQSPPLAPFLLLSLIIFFSSLFHQTANQEMEIGLLCLIEKRSSSCLLVGYGWGPAL